MFRRHPILVFLVLVFGFSLPFYYLLNVAGGRGEGMRLYVTGLMWCPALAAWLACRGGGISLASLGWTWPGPRVQGIAYLIPLAYGLTVYALAWSTGLGAFAPADYAAYAGKTLGLADLSPGFHLALMIALQASVGFVLSCATALGEEIGWRGFLAPRLLARFGFGGGSLAIGLVWALWHFPVLFLANYGGETPRAFAMGCFTISLVGMSFVYSWFRLRSGSLWPAVFLHASHNVFITPVLSMLTADTGHTAWAIDEFGFLLAAVSVLMAAWAWRHRDRALPGSGANAEAAQ
jgi:membrane protease YdiL (CAAX protease family)